MKQVIFVLGGNDGEMETIKNLLSAAGINYIQPKYMWGDHRFSPADLGLRVVTVSKGSQGGYPLGNRETIEDDPWIVFVECEPEDWPTGAAKAVVIDHHGDKAGRPSAITQVVAYLRQLPGRLRQNSFSGDMRSKQEISSEASCIEVATTFSATTARWIELIAANDARYIPGMMAVGATQEETERVRLFDRSAQGITPAHEAEAERAIAAKETEGRLTVVRMAHSKTATVTDRLFGQYDQLLILSSGDGESNFFGDGALCAELKEKVGGWNGGSGLGKAGASAFWGGNPDQEEVLRFIRRKVK